MDEEEVLSARQEARNRILQSLREHRARTEALIQDGVTFSPEVVAASHLKEKWTPSRPMLQGSISGLQMGDLFRNRGELSLLGIHTNTTQDVCTSPRNGQASALVLCPPPDALPSEDVDGDSSSDSRSSSSSSDKQNQPLAKRAESKGKSKGGCQLRTSRGWDGARGEHWASDGYSGYRYSNEGDVRETPEGEGYIPKGGNRRLQQAIETKHVLRLIRAVRVPGSTSTAAAGSARGPCVAYMYLGLFTVTEMKMVVPEKKEGQPETATMHFKLLGVPQKHLDLAGVGRQLADAVQKQPQTFVVEPTKEERRSVEQELKKARKRWGSDEARWREQQQARVKSSQKQGAGEEKGEKGVAIGSATVSTITTTGAAGLEDKGAGGAGKGLGSAAAAAAAAAAGGLEGAKGKLKQVSKEGEGPSKVQRIDAAGGAGAQGAWGVDQGAGGSRKRGRAAAGHAAAAAKRGLASSFAERIQVWCDSLPSRPGLLALDISQGAEALPVPLLLEPPSPLPAATSPSNIQNSLPPSTSSTLPPPSSSLPTTNITSAATIAAKTSAALPRQPPALSKLDTDPARSALQTLEQSHPSYLMDPLHALQTPHNCRSHALPQSSPPLLAHQPGTSTPSSPANHNSGRAANRHSAAAHAAPAAASVPNPAPAPAASSPAVPAAGAISATPLPFRYCRNYSWAPGVVEVVSGVVAAEERAMAAHCGPHAWPWLEQQQAIQRQKRGRRKLLVQQNGQASSEHEQHRHSQHQRPTRPPQPSMCGTMFNARMNLLDEEWLASCAASPLYQSAVPEDAAPAAPTAAAAAAAAAAGSEVAQGEADLRSVIAPTSASHYQKAAPPGCCAYTANGHLVDFQPQGVHECAPGCARHPLCARNKQVSEGIRVPLEVFRRSSLPIPPSSPHPSSPPSPSSMQPPTPSSMQPPSPSSMQPPSPQPRVFPCVPTTVPAVTPKVATQQAPAAAPQEAPTLGSSQGEGGSHQASGSSRGCCDDLWGVRCPFPIQKGEFVCCLVGELVTYRMAVNAPERAASRAAGCLVELHLADSGLGPLGRAQQLQQQPEQQYQQQQAAQHAKVSGGAAAAAAAAGVVGKDRRSNGPSCGKPGFLDKEGRIVYKNGHHHATAGLGRGEEAMDVNGTGVAQGEVSRGAFEKQVPAGGFNSSSTGKMAHTNPIFKEAGVQGTGLAHLPLPAQACMQLPPHAWPPLSSRPPHRAMHAPFGLHQQPEQHNEQKQHVYFPPNWVPEQQQCIAPPHPFGLHQQPEQHNQQKQHVNFPPNWVPEQQQCIAPPHQQQQQDQQQQQRGSRLDQLARLGAAWVQACQSPSDTHHNEQQPKQQHPPLLPASAPSPLHPFQQLPMSASVLNGRASSKASMPARPLLVIDMSTQSNVGRWIGCPPPGQLPNLVTQVVYARRCRSVVLHYVALFAARDIPALQPLTYAHSLVHHAINSRLHEACNSHIDSPKKNCVI